jgi:hypothetical protein
MWVLETQVHFQARHFNHEEINGCHSDFGERLEGGANPTATPFCLPHQLNDWGTRRESVKGHRFPMPHLSRRGDKRVEMGHCLEGGEALSSYHVWMFIPPARPSIRRVTSERGRGRRGTYICTYIHTDGRTYGCTYIHRE